MYEKIGHGIVRILDGIVSAIAVTGLLCIGSFGVYALYDTKQMENAAGWEKYASYCPKEDESASFADLQRKNPDVTGWITVYGTGISYPFAWTIDGDRYVNTAIDGSYSLSGAVFLSALNHPDFSDLNSVLYGHHMADHKMFGDVGLFAEKAFFQSHPYGDLYFQGKHHGLRTYAYLTCDAYDSTVYDPCSDPDRYVSYLLSKAEYVSDLTLTPQDHLVLLSTCADGGLTNERYVLAMVIEDEVYPDPFQKKKTERLFVGTDDTEKKIPGLIIALIVMRAAVRRRKKK